jgi:hypothetical protein
VATFAANASDSSSFRNVPAAEIPGKTASIVKSSQDPKHASVEVVQAAVAANPAAAPAIVGAVARSVPGAAATAAGAAAGAQPAQAEAIAKAAAAAAPSKAGAITEQVVKAVPANYKAIAAAVLSAAPKASRDILAGVAKAIPALKPGIERALAAYRGSVPVVAALEQAARPGSPVASADPSPAPPVGGPTVGDPFVPYTGNVGTVTPGGSVEVPPGGRNYSAP